MKKILTLFILSLFISPTLYAQDYQNAVGLRGGLFSGLTFKHFNSENVALEGILSTRWSGFEVTGLYEIHTPAFHVSGMNFYYGGGAHLGFYNGDNTNGVWGDTGKSYTLIGIDGILGLDYKIPGAPIDLSLDWKPAFNLSGYSNFIADGFALSARFTF